MSAYASSTGHCGHISGKELKLREDKDPVLLCLCDLARGLVHRRVLISAGYMIDDFGILTKYGYFIITTQIMCDNVYVEKKYQENILIFYRSLESCGNR